MVPSPSGAELSQAPRLPVHLQMNGRQTGTFGTIQPPDGEEQITSNGTSLSTRAEDPQPGQANGHGIGGTRFAVTSQSAEAVSDQKEEG